MTRSQGIDSHVLSFKLFRRSHSARRLNVAIFNLGIRPVDPPELGSSCLTKMSTQSFQISRDGVFPMDNQFNYSFLLALNVICSL
jgi:hypothetical protein